MANPQEKLAAPISESSPLAETHFSEDYEAVISSGCCCFHRFCWKTNNDGSHRYLLSKQEEINDGWFVEKAKKLKEISEILAGPRWKNFIRRFTTVHGFNKKRRIKCQYDPQSYALNFDNGIDKEVEDSCPDFSARFATPKANGV
ncbi:uncharacterized protein LOC110603320 [Manihot esculenta]|uniref:Uncharacterized protein n=1 Tax=Manihot esculenta TaxID=3983 RepID=A0A2C9UC68_MANES|nr:uncharacterized protein LOC110603320 [Manihot esculenta]OAY27447.1 hypothetical protein MANES_16G126000v8 [Manihot esculenta]